MLPKAVLLSIVFSEGPAAHSPFQLPVRDFLLENKNIKKSKFASWIAAHISQNRVV